MEETTKAQGASVYEASADEPSVTDERPRGPHNIQNHAVEFDASIRAAEDDAAAAERARFHGVSVALMESGTQVHDLIQELLREETHDPDHLRPVADAFRRHLAAKEATVGRALESRSSAAPVVRRDREEGVQLLALLDGAIASPIPEGVRSLTVGGVLADLDQYVAHERRDLVPVIERELPVSQSDRLAAEFRR